MYRINNQIIYIKLKKLVEIGINEIKEIGFDKMIIGCLEDNPSNEFYKHIRFIFVKTRIFEKSNMIENIYKKTMILNIYILVIVYRQMQEWKNILKLVK